MVNNVSALLDDRGLIVGHQSHDIAVTRRKNVLCFLPGELGFQLRQFVLDFAYLFTCLCRIDLGLRDFAFRLFKF